MPGERDDRVYLWDMWQHANDVVRFVEGRSFDQYVQDRMLQLAVERAIQILGEAAGQLSREFREAHAEIPWQKIIAQRHRITHEYYGMAHSRIWRVAVAHVPELIQQLRPLVPEPPEDLEQEGD